MEIGPIKRGHDLATSAMGTTVNLPLLSRRHFLSQSASGFGTLALAWLTHREALHSAIRSGESLRLPHFNPIAKRVIHIFCAGGVSHIDTFDHKPELDRFHGKSLENKGENKGFFGQPGNVMRSPFRFSQHGQSGHWISSLLPHLAQCVDDVAFVHSMVARSNNHTPATFQMNTGFTLNGFPCMGSWVSYGLGTENEDLPAFVVLPDPRGMPAGGSINWTSGFLPANHQGVPFKSATNEPIPDLKTPDATHPQARSASMKFLADMNHSFANSNSGDSVFAARLRSYELAARMQLSVPEALSIQGESPATLAMYGVDRESTKGFARNCLLARRLLERNVRFVQLFNGGSFGSPRINWDGHEDLKSNHENQAATMDQPVAALIKDLKQRGLFEDTLLIWSTEFGRGPATQGIGATGRDHHPDAFTCFLAGAGIRPGVSYGGSDEVGYFASEKPVSIHDLHATALHLMGINHERLTFYHNGVNRRLTDVHGHVVQDVLV